MNRRVYILQYIKGPSGDWHWKPIPRNRHTSKYLWAKLQSDQLYVVWRESGRRRYEKAGTTPAEALEAQRRKEFELAGRAVLERAKRLPVLKNQNGVMVQAAVSDYLDFVKKKKRPNTYKRYRAVMDHFQRFFKPHASLASITPSEIDAYRDERLAQKNPWGKPITARNVNSEVAMIRAFFYYFQRFRDPSLANPVSRMKPLAATRTVVETYEEDELDLFFAACTPEELAWIPTEEPHLTAWRCSTRAARPENSG